MIKKEGDYPPMEEPTKNKLEIKPIVSGDAISVWMVLQIGITPSRMPWIKRIANAGYTLSHSPKAIMQTTLTNNHEDYQMIQLIVRIMANFLPMRSANHPQNKLPIICPIKNNDTNQEL